jgi:hypothetical protein
VSAPLICLSFSALILFLRVPRMICLRIDSASV